MTSSSSPHQHATTLESRKEEIREKIQGLYERLYSMKEIDTRQTSIIQTLTTRPDPSKSAGTILIEEKMKFINETNEKLKFSQKHVKDLTDKYETVMRDIAVEINHVTSLESAKMKNIERLRDHNTWLQEHKVKNEALQQKLDNMV
jgi:hypothetical protein